MRLLSIENLKAIVPVPDFPLEPRLPRVQEEVLQDEN